MRLLIRIENRHADDGAGISQVKQRLAVFMIASAGRENDGPGELRVVHRHVVATPQRDALSDIDAASDEIFSRGQKDFSALRGGGVDGFLNGGGCIDFAVRESFEIERRKLGPS